MPSHLSDIERASRAILALLARRGDEKTICPSEAARALAGDGDFRPQMPVVREAARILVDRGQIEALQRGRVIDLDEARGPLRLRIARSTRREN